MNTDVIARNIPILVFMQTIYKEFIVFVWSQSHN